LFIIYLKEKEIQSDLELGFSAREERRETMRKKIQVVSKIGNVYI
jgi:hypothetical protein